MQQHIEFRKCLTLFSPDNLSPLLLSKDLSI